MSMAKLMLDNEALAEEFFEDALLLGMQCPATPHRFIWLINRQLGFNFRYQQGTEILLHKKGRQFSFPVFQFNEANLAVQHTIYTNQYDGEYLLPELKHTDFLWLMKGHHPDVGFVQLLAAELRKVESMQLVTILSNDKIKNKQHLVL
jgi:hypothetical protein